VDSSDSRQGGLHRRQAHGVGSDTICNDPRSTGDAPASLDGIAPAAAAWEGDGRRIRGILF
jgi:hypothetical protein